LCAIQFVAEDDRRGGFFNTVDTADLVEQLVELLRGIGAQPGHVIELAADGAELLHLGHGAEFAQHFLAGARLHGDANIRLQTPIGDALTEAHAVTGDYLGFLQPRKARGDRSARDAELASEHGHAFASVELQRGDQLAVDFV